MLKQRRTKHNEPTENREGLSEVRLGSRTTVFLYTICLALLAFCLATMTCMAQNTSGSLSGIVRDSTDAVVPDSAVVLKNEATGADRSTNSNGSGNFTFVAVPSGSYTITITHAGFAPLQIKGIVLDEGENRTIPQIVLNVGVESATVTVSADTETIPVDTGQIQTTLNTHEVTELSIEGRDAAELIKVMPGLALNTGLGQTEYSSLTTSTGNGPGDAFSASGTVPNGGLELTLDGAIITDPGQMGGQVINVNQDMTAQVSILNSAFGAEYAKGPVLFQALSKSGGNQFHGNAYLYARNGALNANDAYFKASGVARPDDRQMYPGFTIGGPVLIPGLNFNRARNKLFFFSGYEYNYQHPAGTLHQLFVPTAQMLAGDFDPNYLASIGQNGSAVGNVPCASVYYGYCPTSGIVNGVIPQSQIDTNALALMKLFPAPNQDPATHNGFNYIYNDNPPVNRYEVRERLDYDPSEKSQISGSYTQQNEGDIENFGAYYEPGATLPYPSQMVAHSTAQLWTGNYTRSFGASATNNLVVSYSTHAFPLKPTNPSAFDPATVGFTATGAFQNHEIPQVPNLLSYTCWETATSGCFPGLFAPTFTTGFHGGAFGNTLQTPAISNDFSKVIGKHTIKVGAYWDLQREIQTSGAADVGVPQGQYDFENYGQSTGTNNPVADFVLGHAFSYTQVNAIPIQDIRFNQYSLYAQDQWKVRRLTFTYGLRLDHEGQWYPANHPGFAVWDPSTYSNAPNAPAFTGLTWHAKNRSVPVSGWNSSLFRPLPRIGVAYDIFGTGKTVVRGGYGVYLFQVSFNSVQGAFNQALNIQSVSTPSLNSFANAADYGPSVNLGQNGNVTALMMGDNRTPYTQSYNVTVSQRGPIGSVFEFSYSGNVTRDELLDDSNAGAIPALSNLNKIPVGALFGPDPITGITYAPGQVPGGSLQDYRPYQNYQILNVTSHGSYSNYNAFVASVQKQRGPVTLQINYTFSKVLGIWDGQIDNGDEQGYTTDTFNLRVNYGPLSYDRTHIFNSAYIVQLPSPVHGNRFLQGAVNGWQLSGITQVQSGPPLQPNTNGTFNSGFLPGVSNQSILGTDSQVLRPLVTCNPRSQKYFDPSCFASPTQINQNGPAVFPNVKGAAFLDTDLGVYKNFAMRDKQSIQFRLSGFNFINHPLPQFGIGPDVDLELTGGANGTNTNTATTGRPQFEVGRRVIEVAIKYVF
jgi:hypothetical protein